MNRRTFLCGSLGLAASSTRPGTSPAMAGADGPPVFLTRGVVLVPEDLTLADWPERARQAGLTTIGIHHQNSPQAVIDWIKADAGQRFLGTCSRLGLEVEYELHAMKELLPRSLFDKDKDLFRMDETGGGTPTPTSASTRRPPWTSPPRTPSPSPGRCARPRAGTSTGATTASPGAAARSAETSPTATRRPCWRTTC